MQTVSETRKSRLELLIKRHGSIAELNGALGWSRTDPKLSQIRNANIRRATGKFHQMGDAMAREIETRLKLGHGWMDTPPTYAELQGEDDPKARAWAVFESIPDDQWPQVLKLVQLMAQPVPRGSDNPAPYVSRNLPEPYQLAQEKRERERRRG